MEKGEEIYGRHPAAIQNRHMRRPDVRRRGKEAAIESPRGEAAQRCPALAPAFDVIVVAESTRPFVERFRDYPDVIRAPTGIDLLIHTPEEFAQERRCNRFVRQALREGRRLL